LIDIHNTETSYEVKHSEAKCKETACKLTGVKLKKTALTDSLNFLSTKFSFS